MQISAEWDFHVNPDLDARGSAGEDSAQPSTSVSQRAAGHEQLPLQEKQCSRCGTGWRFLAPAAALVAVLK